MKDYLIAFVISFLGSMGAAWLSAALARLVHKRFPLLAQSCNSDPAQAFPKAWCLRTYRCACIPPNPRFSWCCF